ncbi:MAG: hypothetical protein OEV72_07725 [Thermoleophilia bacterium]|nr:hypothetical protein [Thermoleophilia bacterium]MDH5333207.1 hypothetical protein [Thermoleophilia bacterium]
MLLLVLLEQAQPLMLLTLAIAMYLTVIELRELRPHFLWWSWWLMLVFLTHFIGYLVLRGYVLVRRWQQARA